VQWILVLFAIIGIELGIVAAFALPKPTHPAFLLIEDPVELFSLPGGVPRVYSRKCTFHTPKRIHEEYTVSTAKRIYMEARAEHNPVFIVF
jgi:hypothetical protein